MATSVLGSQALLSGIFTCQGVCTSIFATYSSGIHRRVGLWQNTGNSFEVTATMSLLCIYSHIEDGCSWRSGARTEKSSQTLCFFKTRDSERIDL